MTNYQVNELFHSIQGEGMHSGKAATFIRLQGCTVGCPWCDSGPFADKLHRATNGMTRNTWGKGGTRRSAFDIALEVFGFWGNTDDAHIIITGGEPTLYNLDELIDTLRIMRLEGGRWPYIQLETSGQNELKGVLTPDWITVSPKANLQYQVPDKLLARADELKFVVDSELTELNVADLEAHTLRINEGKEFAVVLMPEGCPPKPENFTKAYKWALNHPGWRVMDRLQYRMGVR
jgi:7-carboxy-7-deazaguanine synthase